MKHSIDLRFIVCTLPKQKSIRVLLVVGNSKNMHCSTTVLVPGMSQMCPWHHGNEPFNFSQTRNGEHLQFLPHELPLTKTGRTKIKSELKAWNNWWTHSSMGLDPELQTECTAGSHGSSPGFSAEGVQSVLVRALPLSRCTLQRAAAAGAPTWGNTTGTLPSRNTVCAQRRKQTQRRIFRIILKLGMQHQRSTSCFMSRWSG